MDRIEEFKRQMIEHNLDSGEIKPDGVIHRFQTWGDGVNETSGAYWHNGRTGWLMDWRSMSKPVIVKGEITKADQEALNGSFTGANNKVSRKALQAGVRRIWNAGTDPDGHPYLQRKGITAPPEVKQHDGCLIIPVFGVNGELNGLQRIDADGRKRFLAGTRKKGSFFSISGNGTYIICEGFSTGLSLHEATGASVAVAFDAGNLVHVAKAVSKKVSPKNIIIAGDDDSWKLELGKPNIGADMANKAAQAIGAAVMLPEFKKLNGKQTTDFNDLHRIEGLDAIKAQFEAFEERIAIQEEGQQAEQDTPKFEFIHNADILENLKPVQWQIEKIMENNILYYNFGDAGHFKTFVEIDRLLHIATGLDYHGHKVKQGTVYYIAGEGQQGIGRRIAAWHIYHKTSAKDVPFFIARTPTQLMDKGAIEEVKRAVDYMSTQYGPPAIIHIDTLARNFGEGSENKTEDMNRVINNMDTIFGTDIGRGLTHHTGHANKERARGSYALHGAADSAFRIEYRQDKTVLVTCKKMKDAPFAPAMLFDTTKILLQIDNHFDSSYVLELNAEGDEIPGMADNKMEKVNAVVKALEMMGGCITGQFHLISAVTTELDCKDKTAQRAIKTAVEMRKIIEVPGKGKGNPNVYKLPE